jgi:hypothetical protein
MKSQSKANIEKLTKAIEDLNGNNNFNDDRFWRAEQDKAGNGFAIIRFLPAPDGEDIPWVRLFSHSFQGAGLEKVGKWYIENCPTTIGGKCICCQKNGDLWESGIESQRKIVSKRKRKLSYISNIYVVSDPAHKENEGKVFLFKYGKKIFDKLMDKMQPKFPDESPMNPFDLWGGANFRLKICKVEGYANFDKSEFAAPTPFMDGDDAKLEALWKSEFPLKPIVDPSQFKPYEELEKRFNMVVNSSAVTANAHRTAETTDLTSVASPKTVATAKKTTNAPVVEAPATQDDENVGGSGSDGVADEDDALNYFQRLANSDDE